MLMNGLEGSPSERRKKTLHRQYADGAKQVLNEKLVYPGNVLFIQQQVQLFPARLC